MNKVEAQKGIKVGGTMGLVESDAQVRRSHAACHWHRNKGHAGQVLAYGMKLQEHKAARGERRADGWHHKAELLNELNERSCYV